MLYWAVAALLLQLCNGGSAMEAVLCWLCYELCIGSIIVIAATLGGYALAALPWQLCNGSYAMAGMLWQVFYGNKCQKATFPLTYNYYNYYNHYNCYNYYNCYNCI